VLLLRNTTHLVGKILLPTYFLCVLQCRYIPWNLHEPERDVYDFGNGSGDMSSFLDVVKYIKTAQEEDLFVLLRPSPYICAEWDFGGMPRHVTFIVLVLI
jgi:beta-galactosidase GanA